MSIKHSLTAIATTGPNWATQADWGTIGDVFWVDSVNGDDANAGTSRLSPKASIFGAAGGLFAAASSNGDLVIAEANHVETVSAAYTFSKIGVRLLGLGTTATKPKLTSAVAGVFITITGAENALDNFNFPVATAATTAKISLTTGNGALLRGLDFEAGANDQTDQILINSADNLLVESCTFTVKAAAGAGTTQTGITMTGTPLGCRLRDLTFDGGSFGWTQAAFEIDAAGADSWEVERLVLKNYSFFKVSLTGAKGRWSGITADATSGLDLIS